MKFKSTYIIVVVAVAMAAFAYIYEYKGGKTRDEAKQKESKVFDLKDTDITSIGIDRPKIEKLALEKGEGGWNITSPLKARADDSAIGNVTWQIADLAFTQIAEAAPKNLEPYGLASPEIVLTFIAGGKTKKVYFGADTKIGFETYIKVEGETRVLTVNRNARQAIDKHAVDFRDKKVAVFDREKLFELEMTSGETSVSFEKIDNNWNIKSPIKGDASEEMVQGAIDQVANLEATEFVPAPVAMASGISTPELEITLVIGDKERARKKISFFKTADNKVLAHPEGDAWYYAISPEIISTIMQKPEEYREKKVLKLNRFDLAKIEVNPSSKDKKVVIEKNDAGSWIIVEPTSAKGEAAASKVFDLLDSLENLTAEKFADASANTGVKNEPSIILYSVEAAVGNDKTKKYKEVERLFVGNETEDGMIYVKGLSPQIFLVGKGLNLPEDAGYFKVSDNDNEPEPQGGPDEEDMPDPEPPVKTTAPE